MKEEILNFSVVDTERKYGNEYTESVYGKDSVVSYGEDNGAPALFFKCYAGSATLKSVVDGTVSYILGEQVVVDESAEKWAEKVNRTGMTMRQLIAHIALDYMIYGGFAIQVIYSKIGTVCELYPLNFAKCRTNEDCTKIFFNKKGWSKWATKTAEYDRFDRETYDSNNPSQVFYFKGDFTKNVYPLPVWNGALLDVLTEMECSKYSLNSVANGFTARYALQFLNSGSLPEAQKELVEKSIKEKFCGSDNNNFMLYFSPSSDKMEITKIESDDTPEKFIAIKDNARSNIYTSMRCTPLLMGLPNASNGFSTNEYKDAFKLYQKTVIQQYQDAICESINKIIGEGAVSIAPFSLQFDEE